MKKTYPELEKLLTVFHTLGYESAYIEKDYECTDDIDGTSLEIPYYIGLISVWYVEGEKSYYEVHITNDDDQDDYSEFLAYTREGVVLNILNEIF